MTLADFRVSLSWSNFPRMEGTICHDNPYLSFSQPHLCFSPPAESFSQNSSTSSCVSQFTKNEMAGEKVKTGPPFSAKNSCPSSSKIADITVPFGPGPASPYRVMRPVFEFLKMET